MHCYDLTCIQIIYNCKDMACKDIYGDLLHITKIMHPIPAKKVISTKVHTCLTSEWQKMAYPHLLAIAK